MPRSQINHNRDDADNGSREQCQFQGTRRRILILPPGLRLPRVAALVEFRHVELRCQVPSASSVDFMLGPSAEQVNALTAVPRHPGQLRLSTD